MAFKTVLASLEQLEAVLNLDEKIFLKPIRKRPWNSCKRRKSNFLKSFLNLLLQNSFVHGDACRQLISVVVAVPGETVKHKGFKGKGGSIEDIFFSRSLDSSIKRE